MKEVGFTCGAFDLLHPGHVHFLKLCRESCDELIVGLHVNPKTDRASKNAPLQSTFERYYQISALGDGYKIIPYDTEHDLENMLAVLDINFRFVGSDYIDKPITGAYICEARGINIVYIPRLHSWSSSELRKRIA